MSPPRLRTHGLQNLQKQSPDRSESKRFAACSASGNLKGGMAALVGRSLASNSKHGWHLMQQSKLAGTEISRVTATAAHGTSVSMQSHAFRHGSVMLPCGLHGPFPCAHNPLGHRSLDTDARSHANTTRARSASQRNFQSCTVRGQSLKPFLCMHLVN
jgi:hypothetical protein